MNVKHFSRYPINESIIKYIQSYQTNSTTGKNIILQHPVALLLICQQANHTRGTHTPPQNNTNWQQYMQRTQSAGYRNQVRNIEILSDFN
jgi:hypothetical protein